MNTTNKMVSSLCLLLCILCLTLSYSHIIVAQETEVREREARRDRPSTRTVIHSARSEEDEEVEITGEVDAGETPVIQRVSGETPTVQVYVERESDDPDDRERIADEEGPQEGSPAEESSVPGSINPEEIKRRMLERRKRVMEGKQEELWPVKETQAAEPEPQLQPQMPEGQQQGGGRPDAPAGDERQDYVSAIVDNNLFRPLGSGGERSKTQYALTAVISDSDGESNNKAIIEEKGGNKSYYVYEGDTFANEIAVETIDEDLVTLDREGEPIELRLGEGTSSGSRGGGRSSRRSSGGGGGNRGSSGRPSNMSAGPGGVSSRGGSSRGGRSGFDPSRIPEDARRMLRERGISVEQLRNNPALQQRLRGEFMRRFGGGGDRSGGRDRGRRGGR